MANRLIESVKEFVEMVDTKFPHIVRKGSPRPTPWDCPTERVPGAPKKNAPEKNGNLQEIREGVKTRLFEDKKSQRPILKYEEGCDYTKVSLAGCKCATRKQHCYQDVCECSEDVSREQPECGCRVEKCAPWESAQRMF